MNLSPRLFLVVFILLISRCFAEVPQTALEAWASFAPAAEPLEAELIRETRESGMIVRQVRYVVGTFGGKKTYCAAFFAMPEGGTKLPGIVQIHGGGQRARIEETTFWAGHQYAAIAINWGELEIGQEGDPNTDWAGIPAGFLEPKHYNPVTPETGTLHDEPHPWNSSWLLYSAAARRAITYLQAQPEVDGSKIGVTGHSMGGRITILTAIDPRVTAVSPSVGGSGFLYSDIAGIPHSARHMRAELPLYQATISCQNYWPHIQCPVMFLGASNDFNSPMEMVVRGFNRLPNDNGAMSFTPHMNHRFTANNYAARVCWFETHLKQGMVFPKMAAGQLHLNPEDGIPQFIVRPEMSSPHAVKSVEIFYGYERDPRIRFWRRAEITQKGDVYIGRCPVMDLNEPLFAFANVTYETGTLRHMPRGMQPTSLLTITSDCLQAFPHQLAQAKVKQEGTRQRLIEDFAGGWDNWSQISMNNREHWQAETYKVNDPAFFGPQGATLAIDVETSGPEETLAVVLQTDSWRGYTARKNQRYVAMVPLVMAGAQTLELSMERFVNSAGESLASYDFVTSLTLSSGWKENPEVVPTRWKSDFPRFTQIRWVGGEFAARPRPYLRSGESSVEADAAFRDQFEKAVDESVKLEALDRK